LTLLFLACAGSREVIRFEPAKITLDELIENMKLHDSRLDGIMGRMSISIETPTMESSFEADYYFSAPDSFRANIRGLLGTTPGALVNIGDSTAAYFPGQGTLYVAVAEPGIENPVLGLNMEFADLVRALSGIFGVDELDSFVAFEDLRNFYELIYLNDGDFVRAEILPSRWVLGSKQIYNQDGTSLLDISYGGFTEIQGMTRATEITIINPMRNEKVKVEIKKEYIGRELPKGIFELGVPENVAVVYML